jgi:hypothetical protein
MFVVLQNIVPLLGVCVEPPCLVYTLMANNSLRSHLLTSTERSANSDSFSSSNSSSSRLTWRLRCSITRDVACG